MILRFLRFILVGILVSSLGFVSSETLFADSKTKEVKSKITWEKGEVQGLKTQTVKVIDPNEQVDVEPKKTPAKPMATEYQAYDGAKFLDHVFGGRSQWSKKKWLVFTCLDGYQPILPVEDFLKGKGNFFMAVARKDGGEFAILNQIKEGKKEAVGPLYVVWVNPEMQTKEKAHHWPYQVVSITASNG